MVQDEAGAGMDQDEADGWIRFSAARFAERCLGHGGFEQSYQYTEIVEIRCRFYYNLVVCQIDAVENILQSNVGVLLDGRAPSTWLDVVDVDTAEIWRL